jgi:SAM-dependent methyltransferase
MAEIPGAVRENLKKAWGAGRWDDVSPMIATVGPRLLDEVGIEPGMDVLDVGTGSGGTVAIPAAQRGAKVVGSDLVPEHFEDGRRRAAEAGVEVEWVEASAESLPFDDGSFDRVLSTFGHMFAPDHAAAAGELARVCRPGGIVGTATWRPTGAIGEQFKIIGSHMPPPPEGVGAPPRWGDEDYVRSLFEPHGLELEFKHATCYFDYPGSPDEFVTFYEENLGPVVSAKAALGEKWPALRADLLEMYTRHNEGGEDNVHMPSEYLITIGRKRA